MKKYTKESWTLEQGQSFILILVLGYFKIEDTLAKEFNTKTRFCTQLYYNRVAKVYVCELFFYYIYTWNTKVKIVQFKEMNQPKQTFLKGIQTNSQ